MSRFFLGRASVVSTSVVRVLSLVAVGSLALHCTAEEPSCELTLTCDTPYLDEDCRWRNTDGSQYTGGPLRNEQGLWVWPNGEVSSIQTYVCQQQLAVSADASVVPSDAGMSEGTSSKLGTDAGPGADAGADAGSLSADAAVADAGLVADAGTRRDAGDPPGSVLPPATGDCLAGQTQRCGATTNVGLCNSGTQACVNGSWGTCEQLVLPAARDCSSPLDNDCDGLPDNIVDAVCECLIGATAACGIHPGLDNVAQCRAGTQICEGRASNTRSRYAACQGSVAPYFEDGCVTRGDDSDCNGTANQGCDCIAAEGNIGCAENADASRCDPWGYCEPCNTSADCSLIPGLPRCAAGECLAALPPPVVPAPPVVTTPAVPATAP